MISVIISTTIILGFCFLLMIRYGQDFSIALPISIANKVIILFLFGLIGLLKIGVFCIIFIAVSEYLYIAIFCIRSRKKIQAVNLIDGNIIVFTIALIVICWCMYGKMFDSWDEFSHWGDVVKVLTTIDDYATNPSSFSWFATYPPGMSLFQYFFQKINGLVQSDVYCEWITYVAYQMFVVAFMLPFVENKVSKRQIWRIPLNILVILVLPLLFGVGVYRYIYIDPVIGILFACGIMGIIYKHHNMRLHIWYETSVCTMLVLAKDAGLLFAVMIVFACIMDLFLNSCSKTHIKYIFTMITSVVVLKCLWGLHLKQRGCIAPFSEKIDFGDFINVILGKTVSYRSEVLTNFILSLKTDCFAIRKVHIPRFEVNVILLSSFFIMLLILKKVQKISNATIVLLCGSVFLCEIFYIFGMLLTYMYKFSETEALICASFDRYVSIIYEGIWLLNVFLFLKITNHIKYTYICCMGMGLSMLITFLVARENIIDNITRQSVMESISFRSAYMDMTQKIVAECREDNVFLISQGDSGLDLCVLKSAIRPNVMHNSPWSFGSPLYEDDVYTYDCSASELKENIKSRKCSYVALYNSSSSFVEQYSELFEEGSDIASGKLYHWNERDLLAECK